MTTSDNGNTRDPPTRLEGTVKTVKRGDRSIDLVIRVRNPGGRALHYVSDLRGLLYDPVTRRLTVRLTDEGRILVPSAVARLPRFAVIDPHSEAEVAVRLPVKIVKLADTPSPPGDVLLQEHDIRDASDIAVDIAWADTPFYQDPREADDPRFPAVRWQQDALHVSRRMRPRKR